MCDSDDEVLVEVARHADVVHGMHTVPADVVTEVRSPDRRAGVTSSSTSVDEPHWPSLLDAAARDVGIEAHYQPIVDLARGVVVGYEALARFSEPGPRGPDQWFSAARAAGRLAELEAAALRAALRHRDALPVNTFLTVNLGPDVLTHPVVQRTLEEAGRLDGVFIELTEHAPIGSWQTLLEQLDRLREAGALIAMDDAGAGHAGLNTMLRLRPDLIKLDRDLVTDVHQDEAKRVLVEMVGTLADRLDAWLLAEGIETWAEAEVLARMGIPLGQGYFLARPAPPWAGLDPDTALKLMSLSRESDTSSLRYLLQTCATASAHDPDPSDSAGPVVVLDVHSRPVALRRRGRRDHGTVGGHQGQPRHSHRPSRTQGSHPSRRAVVRARGLHRQRRQVRRSGADAEHRAPPRRHRVVRSVAGPSTPDDVRPGRGGSRCRGWCGARTCPSACSPWRGGWRRGRRPGGGHGRAGWARWR